MKAPALMWDWGTAYDMFVSLAVLHDPARFGVRRAWAAGVRAPSAPHTMPVARTPPPHTPRRRRTARHTRMPRTNRRSRSRARHH